MRNIGIIARYEVGRLIRSTGGVLFLALAVTIYAYVTIKLVKWAAEFKSASDLAAGDPGANVLTGAIGWLVDIEPGQLNTLIAKHPPFALVFFFVALAVNPLLAILGTSDQTASDIQTRNIRYLLLRTDRGSLFWGKVLGSLVFYGLSMALLCGIIAGLSTWAGASTVGDLLYFGRIWLTLTVFALPFIALNAFSGALTGHPGLALITTLGYYMVVWLISTVGGWTSDKAEYIQYLSPSAFKYELATDSLEVLGKAVAHMAIVTTLALGLGVTYFKRRDV